MKANLVLCVLLVLLAVADQLLAQESVSSSATNDAKTKLFEEYKAKAEKGDADTEFNLGRCYENGFGITKDEFEAVKWYRKAAEQGNPEWQQEVGFDYERGFGVSKDYVEAAKWYRKAADQGDFLAQASLGSFYRDGT